MAFCNMCGAQIADGTTTCAACRGKGAVSVTSGAGMADNVAGMLAYVTFIPAVIFLVLEPYNKSRFVRFHAFQSIFFSVAYVVFWTVIGRIFLFGFYTMGFLWSFVYLVWSLLSLGVFLFWLFLMYKAYNNERFMIPVIGEYAARQAG